MKAIQDIAVGFTISILALGTVTVPGCGTAVTPQLVQCKLEALRVLPADPKMVTPYDIEDLVHRLNTCRHAAELADSGAP